MWCFKLESKIDWRQSDILPQSQRHSQLKRRNFLQIRYRLPRVITSSAELLHFSLRGSRQNSPLESSNHVGGEHIYCHPLTVLLYHNSTVSLDLRDDSSWNRNPADFRERKWEPFLYPLKEGRLPHKKSCSWYDIKLHPVVLLQFCGVQINPLLSCWTWKFICAIYILYIYIYIYIYIMFELLLLNGLQYYITKQGLNLKPSIQSNHTINQTNNLVPNRKPRPPTNQTTKAPK